MASKVKLRTDWNWCWDLEKGTDPLVKHLKEIDDIPLRLSSFFNTTPLYTQKTVSIFKSKGDYVLSCFDLSNHYNTDYQMDSLISVSIETIGNRCHFFKDFPVVMRQRIENGLIKKSPTTIFSQALKQPQNSKEDQKENENRNQESTESKDGENTSEDEDEDENSTSTNDTSSTSDQQRGKEDASDSSSEQENNGKEISESSENEMNESETEEQENFFFYDLLLNVSCVLNTLSSDIVLPPSTQHMVGPILITLKKETRRIRNNLNKMRIFQFRITSLILMIQILSYSSLLPIAFEGYQIILLSCFFAPFLSSSFLFCAIEKTCLIRIPQKKQTRDDNLKLQDDDEDFDYDQVIEDENSANVTKFFVHHFLMLFPLSILFVVLFAYSVGSSVSTKTMSSTFRGVSSYTITSLESVNSPSLFPFLREYIRFSQNILSFSLVLCSIICSFVIMFNETPTNASFLPFKNKYWVHFFISSILFQFLFWSLCTLIKTGPSYSQMFNTYYFPVYLVMLFVPIISFFLFEIYKRKRIKQLNIDDKFKTFDFQVRLGRDSPGKIQENLY